MRKTAPKPFTTHAIHYKEGTTFYLLTDGFPDQFGGPKGKKFMYKQFKDILTLDASYGTAIQKQKLTKTFDKRKGNLEQVDDVCIIGIVI